MRDTGRLFPIFFDRVLVGRVMRRPSRVTIFVAAAILAGCATSPRTDGTRAPQDSENWLASGRMAVSGARDGGSGSFIWRQQRGDSTVQLRGPVGIGSLKLSIGEYGLRIDTGDRILEAEAAQAELSARLGAEVPVQSLRYWLRGEPAPGDHVWTRNDNATVLEQQTWRIEYQKFDDSFGMPLPSRFVATNGPAKVRIVIDRWKFE